MKLVTTFLLAWGAGLAAYLGGLALFYEESISSGDLNALLPTSFAATAVALVALYLPALAGLKRLMHGVRPMWAFPLLAMLLGVVPTAMVLLYWGGGLGSLISPEASLFYSMFAAVGIVTGLGYALAYGQDSLIQDREAEL
ncbi:MAG: hypothetical protein ACI835_001820 [Planctomycetota bacterium]|jgi:hypothetical protein